MLIFHGLDGEAIVSAANLTTNSYLLRCWAGSIVLGRMFRFPERNIWEFLQCVRSSEASDVVPQTGLFKGRMLSLQVNNYLHSIWSDSENDQQIFPGHSFYIFYEHFGYWEKQLYSYPYYTATISAHQSSFRKK